MKFSLMFFSSGEGVSTPAMYDRLIGLARIADHSGFERIWLPERHYVRFGALHPAPAVLAAAIASCTKQLRIAAGSVVAPLHHPLEIAESWSVVDNLSRGRVDISLASGWRREDFASRPEAYDDRHVLLSAQIEALRSLWSGAPYVWDMCGETAKAVLRPRPFQRELPLWLTAARSLATFGLAGRSGTNLLTYLVDLGFEGLSAGVDAYRTARAATGRDPQGGEITVMLHGYVQGPGTLSTEALRQQYCDYLVANRDLLSHKSLSRNLDSFECQLVDPSRASSTLSRSDAEALACAQFDRVHERLSLMGRPEALRSVVGRLRDIGVTEIACLVDFIKDFDHIEAALPSLADFRESEAAETTPVSLATPSQAPSRRTVDCDEFYAYIQSIGGSYGPAFRLLTEAHVCGGEAVAEVAGASSTCDIGTVRLDALISLAHLFALSPGLRAATEPLSLPLGLGRFHPEAALSGASSNVTLRAEVTSKGRTGDRDLFDIVVRDPSGAVGARIEDLAFGRLRLSAHDPRVLAADELVKLRHWRAIDTPPGGDPALCRAMEEWTAAPQVSANTTGETNPAGGRRTGPFSTVMLVSLIDGESASETVGRVLGWIAESRSLEGVGSLVVAVTGAARIMPDAAAADPVAAAVWGAVGSVLRAPGQAPVRLVDLDADPRVDVTTQLRRALSVDEPLVAVRGETLFVPELSSWSAECTAGGAMRSAIPHGARVLVTGSSGGLGPWLCDWLGEEGAGAIDLLTRDAARPIPTVGIPRCPVRWIEAQLNDAKALQQALDGCSYDMIFHLAGDLATDAGLDDEARVGKAFAPKWTGMIYLMEALRANPPRQLVLFSSLAALAGSTGQAAYSAANAAMAAAAQHLASNVTTLHFGPWEGAGMVAGSGAAEALTAKGLRPMAPWLALRAMANVLSRNITEAVIADIDMAEAMPAARSKDRPAVPARPLRELSEASLREIVLRLFADILETRPEALDTEANLYALGFDSIMALEMRNAVQADLGIEMQLSSLMDAKSITDLLARLEVDIMSGGLARADEARPSDTH